MSDNVRIGVDVGGTNTDAVALDDANTMLARTKQPTTADVTTGMRSAIGKVLDQLGEQAHDVCRVMLGTTHATNAILERRGLGRVGVIRLGAPATTTVPPLEAWPTDLANAVMADGAVVGGGHMVDGFPIADLDLEAVSAFLDRLAGAADAIAVTGVFSPVFRDQELAVAELVEQRLGDGFPVSLSHEIGSLGLLERENATVLNASLYGVAAQVIEALTDVVAEHGLDVTCFFAQNDGTLMAVDYAERYPVLTIGSGPANSIRGAAYLSGVEDAIVVDVGGTSSDFGVLTGGFPRQSAHAVDIGGVRTNFRMPDILGFAIGGGTIVTGTASQPTVGPASVGYRLPTQALAFGGGQATLTDAALLAGRTEISGADVSRIDAPTREVLAAALASVSGGIEEAVDMISLGRLDRPLVVVGGGAFLIPDDLPGAPKVLRPDFGDVANAVGAAIAFASGRCDTIVPAGEGRKSAIDEAADTACRRAVQAGAKPDQVEVVELTEVPLSYLPEPRIRIQVRAAGPLDHV